MGDLSAAPATPTPSELDCLAVLWKARTDEGETALRLSQVHERVAKRRAENGEPEPKLTTVSTQLRSLVHKSLLNEVVLVRSAEKEPAVQGQAAPIRTRGALRPLCRSPLTGYEPAHEPGEVLRETFRTLVSAYPESKKTDALVDFARALELPEKTVEELQKLLSNAGC